MKNENISTTTLLLAFNILLVLIGLFMVNKKILNNDEQSDSLKAKIDQIETQLDVLIDDSKTAREKVTVANEDFIQLSNSMAVNDKMYVVHNGCGFHGANGYYFGGHLIG